MKSLIRLSLVEKMLFAGCFLYLLIAALLVDIESYDGFDTLYNARFFLGLTPHYLANRWPLFSLLLAPVEALTVAFRLPPMEVRLVHGVMALAHMAYLYFVWRLLMQFFGRRWTTLIAYVAAVLSYVFFSYAPFLSHDILPGLIFLSMIILADRYCQKPDVKYFLALMFLGAAAALIKPTFGVFWLALLAGRALVRTPPKQMAHLSAMAAGGGAIFWIVMGAVLYVSGTFDPKPWWIRPWLHIDFIANQYPDASLLFRPWVYLWNFPVGYGTLTTALLPAGLYIALKSNSLLSKSTAWSWMIAFVAMNLINIREVRYIAFLAPLSAFLIVPVLEKTAVSRWLRLSLGVFLCFDLFFAEVEALRIFHPFYRYSEAKSFLKPLEEDTSPKNVFMNNALLSFYSPIPTSFAGDRYHRLFHVAYHHIKMFYGTDEDRFIRLPEKSLTIDQLNPSPEFPTNAYFVLVNSVLINPPRLFARRAESWRDLVQTLSRLEQIKRGKYVLRKFVVLRQATQ